MDWSASGWVPVINLTDPGAVDAIADACERVGFFGITNAGVTPGVLDDLWHTARSFFDLPADAKTQVAMPYQGYPYGYSPMAYETLSRSLDVVTPPDLKESFAIGPVDSAEHEFTDPEEAFSWLPNLWPAELPDLKVAWEVAYRELAMLSARLLSMMAVALDLEPGYFEPMLDRHTSSMRSLNYPVTDSPVLPGQQRAGAHTDYGTLTILLADPIVPGLEIERPDGTWVSVHPGPGVLMVNLGDSLAQWTNDRWRSTMHRVVPAGERRQSIAFFHTANWDAVIECLPTCRNEDEAPKYAPVAAGPHLMSKFRATVT